MQPQLDYSGIIRIMEVNRWQDALEPHFHAAVFAEGHRPMVRCLSLFMVWRSF